MTSDDERPPDHEWLEVQEQRYNKGFYPGSGKIHPFFRKLGAPDRAFGIQLSIVSFLMAVLPPVFGLRNGPVYVLLLVIAAILLIGGIGHLRSSVERR